MSDINCIKILGLKIKHTKLKGHYKRKLILGLLKFLWRNFKKSSNYDEIISLGYNCEVQFRIDDFKKVLRLEKSNYLFSWVFITNRDLFLSLLSNFDIIRKPLQFSVLDCGMYENKNLQINFHPRRQNEQFDSEGNLNEEIFKECSEELISRINHLTDKTEELFKSDKRTLFVIKVNKTSIEQDKNYIKNLYKILSTKYETQKFKLLVFIQDSDFNKKEQKLLRESENSKLKIINIKSFAHMELTDTDGDIFGWLVNLYKNYMWNK